MTLAQRNPTTTSGPVAADLPTVDLAGLNAAAALTRRVDTKYATDTERLTAVVADLARRHDLRVLEIDGRREFGYRSDYFDTATLWTFRAHRQRRRRRAKIRIRQYLDSGQSFLEVKLKATRSVTAKHRIPHPPALSESGLRFVDEVLDSAYGFPVPDRLIPALTVSYSRITYLVADRSVRITCDLDLAWSTPDGIRVTGRDGLALVEVKSPSARAIRPAGLARPASGLSKYCVGIAATRPEVTDNPWRRTVRRLVDGPATAG